MRAPRTRGSCTSATRCVHTCAASSHLHCPPRIARAPFPQQPAWQRAPTRARARAPKPAPRNETAGVLVAASARAPAPACPPAAGLPRAALCRVRASALWSFTDTCLAPSKCMRKRGKAGLHNEARTPRKDAKPIRSPPEAAGESRRAAPRAAAAPARRHPEASARRWRRRRSLSRARARRARVLQARATCQLLTSVLRADRHPLGGSPGLRRGRDRRGGRGWHG